MKEHTCKIFDDINYQEEMEVLQIEDELARFEMWDNLNNEEQND